DDAPVVAADARVDHAGVCELQAPGAAALYVARLPLQALLVGNLLPDVVNNPLVLRNRLGCVDAPAMDPRSPLLNHAVSIEWRHSRSDRMRVGLAVVAMFSAAVTMSSAQSSTRQVFPGANPPLPFTP